MNKKKNEERKHLPFQAALEAMMVEDEERRAAEREALHRELADEPADTEYMTDCNGFRYSYDPDKEVVVNGALRPYDHWHNRL